MGVQVPEGMCMSVQVYVYCTGTCMSVQILEGMCMGVWVPDGMLG